MKFTKKQFRRKIKQKNTTIKKKKKIHRKNKSFKKNKYFDLKNKTLQNHKKLKKTLITKCTTSFTNKFFS